MTPEQEQTLAWMRRTRPDANPTPARVLVHLGGMAGEDAVIFLDGSYATVRFGERHEQPRRRDV